MDETTDDGVAHVEAAFAANEDGNLFVQLANAYREAGELQRALRVLRKGLERHVSYVPAFALLGRILIEQGRFPEAQVTYERVLELDEDHQEANDALKSIRSKAKPKVASKPAATPAPPAAEAPQASDEDLMPWETDSPTPRSKWARRGTSASSPAPADPVGPVLTDADFALIPQDDDQLAPVPADPVDAVDSERAQQIISEAGKLDSTAVTLSDLLVGLLEYRDPFFRGGTSQTRLLATAIAKEMGFTDEEVQNVALGAVLRDLGQVPLKGLISKPELGEEGRRRVESHVDTALELLAAVNLPQMVRDVIRHHHERWDGAGYPDSLAGEAIPLGARIVAVADSFAAMISARPHRLPRRVPAALEDIRSEVGKQYDPAVVGVLERVLRGSDWRGLRFGLRHHLLIVDPDESRAMVLATKLCSHGYLAEASFDFETASERVKRSKLAAIVISADTREQDINKLVREVRETARIAMLPVIVTDAGVSARVNLLEAGADVCLSRGASFEELKATVEAFLRREGKSAPMQAKSGDAAPWSGLQGDIEDFPLAWLLQVLNYDARTAAIFLRGEGDDGVIYVKGGSPRHAQTKHVKGEEAFRNMLQWEKGSFTVDPDATTNAHTIKTPLMNLLLDQAVKDDHAAFFGAVTGEDVSGA
jgi:HD-GYP domain-containing protein (c-di-GMP phosphodiesterase class II)/CheY-like chemotaxis protein